MRRFLLVFIIAACTVVTWQYIVNWHTIHGLVYNLLDDKEAAAIKFRAAIDKDPDNLYAQFYLGHLLFEQGDYDDAILHLRKVEQLVPTHHKTQYLLGISLAAQDQMEPAIAALMHANKLSPGTAQYQFQLGLLYKTTANYQQALDALNAAAVNGKQDDELYVNRGYVYLGLDQPVEARQQFQLALAYQPDNFLAQYELSKILQVTGQLDAAYQALEKARLLNPGFLHLHKRYFSLGYALIEAGSTDKALEAFRKVIAINPRNSHVHAELAKIYKAQNQIDDAINEYQIDIEITPDKFFSHYDLGLLYKKKHQLMAAKTSLENAVLLDPEYPYTCKQLREIYVSLDYAANRIPQQIKTNCNI